MHHCPLPPSTLLHAPPQSYSYAWSVTAELPPFDIPNPNLRVLSVPTTSLRYVTGVDAPLQLSACNATDGTSTPCSVTLLRVRGVLSKFGLAPSITGASGDVAVLPTTESVVLSGSSSTDLDDPTSLLGTLGYAWVCQRSDRWAGRHSRAKGGGS